MRIWYQSLVEDAPGSTYFTGLAARARAIARPGTEVRFAGMPPGTYGGKTPAEVVIYPYLMSLHHQSILDNAYRAQREGYDVFVVGSVQDPALDEARSLVEIPVVGYGESAMLVSCMLARKFAVVLFQPGMDQIMDMRIEKLGLAARALSTNIVDVTFGDVTHALDTPGAIVARFEAAARHAIAHGADAIIPGQLYLREAVARAGLQRIDQVPVVDGLATTLKCAEMMHDLHALGIAVSRHGAASARPTDPMIEHARRLHGRGRLHEN
jgi:Asp/Glu/hydantoin racemase